MCLCHCNSSYTHLRKNNLTRLKSAQNTATWILITKMREFHTFLAAFQWLQLQFRVDFKIQILLFVLKSLTGLAPSYITELLSPYEPKVAA